MYIYIHISWFVFFLCSCTGKATTQKITIKSTSRIIPFSQLPEYTSWCVTFLSTGVPHLI